MSNRVGLIRTDRTLNQMKGRIFNYRVDEPPKGAKNVDLNAYTLTFIGDFTASIALDRLQRLVKKSIRTGTGEDAFLMPFAW